GVGVHGDSLADALAKDAVLERVVRRLEVNHELDMHLVHRAKELVEVGSLARPSLDAAKVGVNVDDGKSRRRSVWRRLIAACREAQCQPGDPPNADSASGHRARAGAGP